MKTTAEEFLISKLGSISLDIKEKGNIIFKDSEGFVVMYNRKNARLHVDYANVWSVLSNEYGMEYTEIQTFITDQMLKHLKWRPETPLLI